MGRARRVPARGDRRAARAGGRRPRPLLTPGRPARPPDGVVLVDKPARATSHDLVAAARRRLGRGIRVGHAGTLDPFATGLLLLLVGRATRAQRFFMALPKVYEVEARFGATSTTGDPDGEITETGRVPEGDLPLPTGVVRQRPPAYSAVKIAGERAYKRARRGEDVVPAEREVVVEEFRETGRDGDRRRFVVRCSSGTYVRSLIADLGDAHCTALRRTEIGPFGVSDADAERVIPLGEALDFLPAVELDAEGGRRAAHGQALPGEASGPVRLVDPDGLVAVAEPREGGALRPVVVVRA